MAEPNALTPSDLVPLIGTPNCPIVVDVTTTEDLAEDPYVVPSAIRHRHDDLENLPRRLADRPSIIVCQKGGKLSQGVAAWLRQAGQQARYLAGGNDGWRDHPGALRVPAGAAKANLWVTAERPGLHEFGAIWLIRRFLCRDALVLCVKPEVIDDTAARFDAKPLLPVSDMKAENGLRSAPLDHFAALLADQNRPEWPGIAHVFAGLSSQFHEDTPLLEAGLHLCDAIYQGIAAGETLRIRDAK